MDALLFIFSNIWIFIKYYDDHYFHSYYFFSLKLLGVTGACSNKGTNFAFSFLILNICYIVLSRFETAGIFVPVSVIKSAKYNPPYIKDENTL